MTNMLVEENGAAPAKRNIAVLGDINMIITAKISITQKIGRKFLASILCIS